MLTNVSGQACTSLSVRHLLQALTQPTFSKPKSNSQIPCFIGEVVASCLLGRLFSCFAKSTVIISEVHSP